MNDIELSYAAGLFDGEGCITTKWPSRSQLCLEIQMVSKPSIQRFADTFGADCVKAYEKREGRLKKWRCRIYDTKAIVALNKMLPFLCEKKIQAELALMFKDSICKEEKTYLNECLKKEKKREYI